jgi:hypothetical protein
MKLKHVNLMLKHIEGEMQRFWVFDFIALLNKYT